MNLWIRSQDREKIICCNDIAIATDNEYKIYKIVGYFDKNTEYEDLGFYLTKERALEVLDEIEERIMIINVLNLANGDFKLVGEVFGDGKFRGVGYPYQMPKE